MIIIALLIAVALLVLLVVAALPFDRWAIHRGATTEERAAGLTRNSVG